MYFINQSVHFSYFPISHDTKEMIQMNFSHCDRKYIWNILFQK